MLDIRNTTTIDNVDLVTGQNMGISDIDVDWEEVERLNEEKRKKKELDKQKKAEEKKEKFREDKYKKAYEGQEIQSDIIKEMLRDDPEKEKEDIEQTL